MEVTIIEIIEKIVNLFFYNYEGLKKDVIVIVKQCYNRNLGLLKFYFNFK